MKKEVTVVHLGMEGQGTSAGKAVADAEARIAACMAGEWAPYYITHQGLVAVIARKVMPHTHQWGYRIINPATPTIDVTQDLDVNYVCRPDAVRAAAFDLAQRTGTYYGLKPYLFDAQLAELDQYFDWQDAYKAAQLEGLADQECRRRADRAISLQVKESI